MASFVRGNIILWTATFFDEEGAPIEPESAQIVLNYPNGRSGRASRRAFETVTMIDNDGWKATWDSQVATTGTVYWSMNSTPTAVQDGYFTLVANEANL